MTAGRWWSRASGWMSDGVRLVLLSARRTTGRWTAILPLLPLAWPAFQALRLVLGWRPVGFQPGDVPVLLVGMPLSVLGIALGVRLIAGEIEARPLQIAWTVPGGAHRVWLAKLAAAAGILVLAELLLAAFTWLFLTPFPAWVLWTPIQAALFHLVLAMWLATVARSEVTGALLSVPAWIFALLLGAGDRPSRLSPFFDPIAWFGRDAAEVAAWTVQNRVGILLVIVVLAVLAFERVEDRERMLG